MASLVAGRKRLYVLEGWELFQQDLQWGPRLGHGSFGDVFSCTYEGREVRFWVQYIITRHKLHFGPAPAPSLAELPALSLPANFTSLKPAANPECSQRQLCLLSTQGLSSLVGTVPDHTGMPMCRWP